MTLFHAGPAALAQTRYRSRPRLYARELYGENGWGDVHASGWACGGRFLAEREGFEGLARG